MSVQGNGSLTCTHASAQFTVTAASQPPITAYTTYGFQTAADNHNFDANGAIISGGGEKWTYSNIYFEYHQWLHLNFAYDTTSVDTNSPWYGGWATSAAKEAALEAFEGTSAYWLTIQHGDDIIGKITNTGNDPWSVEYHVDGYDPTNEPSTAARIEQGHPYLRVPLSGVVMFESEMESADKKEVLMNGFSGLLHSFQLVTNTNASHFNPRQVVDGVNIYATDNGSQPTLFVYPDDGTSGPAVVEMD